MKTMSVYGLLGKIYNCNDDLPKRILFRDRIYELDDYNHYVYEVISGSYGSYIDLFDETSSWELDDFLHEQVGIIENDEVEEKKLPEKIELPDKFEIGGCNVRIGDLGFVPTGSSVTDAVLSKINGIIDYLVYLESKGDE